MDDNPGLEATIAVGRRLSPYVHAHARKLTIRRRRKVGVVGTRSVLRVEDDLVVSRATLAVVVNLVMSLAPRIHSASALCLPRNFQPSP